MIPKLMWLHFSSVNPFVLPVSTPGREHFHLQDVPHPCFRHLSVWPCWEELSGCHSWSWPGPDQVTSTPAGTAPFPLLLSPPVPRLGNVSKFQVVNLSLWQPSHR